MVVLINQRVKGVEELFLRRFLVSDEVNVINHQNVNGPKLVLKCHRIAVTNRADGLREMLRAGNERIATNGSDGLPNANNWVFSTAPAAAKRRAGGIDGELSATLDPAMTLRLTIVVMVNQSSNC